VDAAITPDGKKLVVVGKAEVPLSGETASTHHAGHERHATLTRSERRLLIYDVEAQKQIAYVVFFWVMEIQTYQ